jgi:hypothetical protein
MVITVDVNLRQGQGGKPRGEWIKDCHAGVMQTLGEIDFQTIFLG